MRLLLLALLAGPPQFDYDGNGLVNGGTLSGNLKLNNDVKLQLGTNAAYWWVYNSSATQWELWTTNGDGGGTDTLVLVVDDGTAVADFQGGRITNSAAVLKIGTSCTASHSQTGGGYCFGGVGEFEQNTFMDGSTFFGAASRVASAIDFAFGDSDDSRFRWNTAQTAPALSLGVGNTSHTLLVLEQADTATNMGHANQTDPSIIIHSHNASPTTEYQTLAAYGSQTELFKNLTKGSATSVLRIPVAASQACGGMLNYNIMSSDGTDFVSFTGRIIYAVMAKATAETCTLGTAETASAASGGATVTLTGTVCDTTPSNAVDLQLNATTSFGSPTIFRAYYTVTATGPCVPLPQ